MKIETTEIVDTFAEAFRMRYARLIVTADDDYWLEAASREATGFATSVIGCGAEAGVERFLAPGETPDGRRGAALMFFGFSTEELGKEVVNRAGQCLLTCPTTAVFDGLPQAADRVALGKHLRFFGDGFQKSKVIADRRYWRLPVMDGEFLVEETVGVEKGVAGGNFIIEGTSSQAALAASRRVIESLADQPGVILPFPGGIVRSGSKVGSRYKQLKASTNEAFCPTLAGRVQTELVPGAQCAYEIVLDGQDEDAIAQAMAVAIRAAAGDGIVAISASNFGGKLGKFHFHLHELLAE